MPRGALGGQVYGLACPAAWQLRLPASASKPLSAQVLAVSCPSRGNCTSVGTYNGMQSGTTVNFLMGISAAHGRWGTAQQVALPSKRRPRLTLRDDAYQRQLHGSR